MKAASLKSLATVLLLITCFIYAVMPAFASGTVEIPPAAGSDSSVLSQPEAAQDYKELSIADLYIKVRECRQSLLETRLEVLKEANEAKQRLEEIIKNSKQGLPSSDALRKDLETIKESQRVLASILSDIINAATGLDTANAGDSARTELPGFAVAGTQNEVLPSREYLESIIVLYDQKNRQLAKIAESLNRIVAPK